MSSSHSPNLRTGLLSSSVSDTAKTHGTFTPSDTSRPNSATSSGSRTRAPSFPKPSWLRRATTTAAVAEEAGVRRPWLMYLSYYIPCIAWVGQYQWSFLVGDIAAGVTMASIYIPMALSLSANLAHLPPIHGLYGFAIQPLVYALLGSCPTMGVGPEAAGSLLMGNAILNMHSHHDPAFDDEGKEGSDFEDARLAATITAMTGIIALLSGVLRLGFLDSVLSRPLLRGFISGVGFVIFVDQLVPELGLVPLAREGNITRTSTFEKLFWLVQHIKDTHLLTFLVAFISFAIIMVGRVIKQHISPRHPWIHFLPDRFLVVVLSAVFSYVFRWDKQGLEILGRVEGGSGHPFSFHFPVQMAHLNHAKETLSTAFLISVLGFFESVVAAKALGTNFDVSISSNRELVALGTANILGGCFSALPAFGGYGRSKVNKATGGRTPVSSVVLSVCTILTILFVLPYFHYLPRCVLCSMISVVGVSLLEEAPHDVIFFTQIHAYSDLATMGLVFFTTLFWSIPTGIAVGVGISLIKVIKHSTRARIHILGRDPLTGTWKPVEDSPSLLEQPHHILVIKIRESLTFANAGDLSRRLWRIDRYGDSHAHPSLPRLMTGVRGMVFDVAGVGSIDGSGAQVMREMVEGYAERGVSVWFARATVQIEKRMERAGILRLVGGSERVVDSVEDALREETLMEVHEDGVSRMGGLGERAVV